MRERLVLAFVLVTLAVIGLYGVPRAYYLADLVRSDASQRLDSTASLMATAIAERQADGGSVDADLLEAGLVGADRVEFDGAGAEDLVVGAAVPPGGDLAESRLLADGGTLTLRVSGETVSAGIRTAIAPLVLLGIGLAVVAAVTGWLLARRMARPFQELAESARTLGHGQLDLDIPAYSVPEADAIGTSLRSAGQQLDRLVRREREFAANASHQLRTPITALRLGLEDLSLWPEATPPVREELARALSEVDRLNSAIDELLDLARGRRLGDQGEVDLAALLASTGRRWDRRVDDEGRRLVLDAPDPVVARVPVGPVEQILDVLVDNARLHGHGTITVAVRDAGTHLEVTVADEGTADVGPEVFRRGVTTRAQQDGHGLGLAVAADLAEVTGGHLSLDGASPTTRFVLWLPRPS